jgi:hypothetical protein
MSDDTMYIDEQYAAECNAANAHHPYEEETVPGWYWWDAAREYWRGPVKNEQIAAFLASHSAKRLARNLAAAEIGEQP